LRVCHINFQYLDLMRDWLLDEHIMLMGPQGSGKNKLCDHFVRLLNRECNYIQLHRDTTLQSLTVIPTLSDGVLSQVRIVCCFTILF
jgi:MoxR-like ATPase